MNVRQRIVTMAAGVTLLVGGATAAAPTASAAVGTGGCSAGYLCVWSGSSFTGTRINAQSTNSCFTPWNFTHNGIASYVNNLSVNAYVYKYDAIDHYYYQARTLAAGGFSSNIGVAGLGTGVQASGGFVPDEVCEGSATP